MKTLFAISAGSIFAIAFLAVTAWMDSRDRAWLRNDRITACRPPGDQGERLVATLSKSADGGPLLLHCSYHATLGGQP